MSKVPDLTTQRLEIIDHTLYLCKVCEYNMDNNRARNEKYSMGKLTCPKHHKKHYGIGRLHDEA